MVGFEGGRCTSVLSHSGRSGYDLTNGSDNSGYAQSMGGHCSMQWVVDNGHFCEHLLMAFLAVVEDVT